MGRHVEAEPLMVLAMGVYGTALGERHPRYVAVLSDLAGLYRDMSRHGEAEPPDRKRLGHNELHDTEGPSAGGASHKPSDLI
jgi:hypothetical protein